MWQNLYQFLKKNVNSNLLLKGEDRAIKCNITVVGVIRPYIISSELFWKKISKIFRSKCYMKYRSVICIHAFSFRLRMDRRITFEVYKLGGWGAVRYVGGRQWGVRRNVRPRKVEWRGLHHIQQELRLQSSSEYVQMLNLNRNKK